MIFPQLYNDIFPITGVDNTDPIRISCCIAYGIIVYGLLFWDKTHHLSVGLGMVLIGMTALFLVVVITLGVDWTKCDI